MSKQLASILDTRLGLPSWPIALIGIVVIKAVLSLAVEPGSFVVSYSGISYLVLLVLATCFAIRNSIQNTLGGRRFWGLLATAYGLWSAHQVITVYYELVLRVEVPDNSIDDTLLFLHVALLVAAVATIPHRDVSNRKPNTAIANVLFVTLFWIFVYGYVVFPYQYLFRSPTSFGYALRFDLLFLVENLALILTVGILAFQATGPWKSVYFHLLAASTLYTVSSTIANLAIDSGGYANGKLYGLGLTASVCWFAWVPLFAGQVPTSRAQAISFDRTRGSQASMWAMIVVVMISIPIVWELFQRNEDSGLRTVRVVFALVMIVCLASTAYIREHLAKRELAAQAQAALQESEERLRMAVQTGRMFAYSWDAASDAIQRSGESAKILGIDEETHLTGQMAAARVHPDDREDLNSAIARLSPEKPFLQICYRIIRNDLDVVWVERTSRAYFDQDGKILRIVGMVADITDRKLAEEVLTNMNRRLIEAQEAERSRIARDLHDDIGQRLAICTIALDQLKDIPGSLRDEHYACISEIQKQLFDISSSLHTLSHELHSERLELLGLVPAMRACCRDLSYQQKAEINFVYEGPQEALPSEISLCLFRILQEALNNSLKHSGVRQIGVQLRRTVDVIDLIIRDDGAGFDFTVAAKGSGLGLTSMRERLNLVDGQLFIDSKPQYGTTIRARVPLKVSDAAQH